MRDPRNMTAAFARSSPVCRLRRPDRLWISCIPRQRVPDWLPPKRCESRDRLTDSRGMKGRPRTAELPPVNPSSRRVSEGRARRDPRSPPTPDALGRCRSDRCVLAIPVPRTTTRLGPTRWPRPDVDPRRSPLARPVGLAKSLSCCAPPTVRRSAHPAYAPRSTRSLRQSASHLPASVGDAAARTGDIACHVASPANMSCGCRAGPPSFRHPLIRSTGAPPTSAGPPSQRGRAGFVRVWTATQRVGTLRYRDRGLDLRWIGGAG